jgi:hypothetical protein
MTLSVHAEISIIFKISLGNRETIFPHLSPHWLFLAHFPIMFLAVAMPGGTEPNRATCGGRLKMILYLGKRVYRTPFSQNFALYQKFPKFNGL